MNKQKRPEWFTVPAEETPDRPDYVCILTHTAAIWLQYRLNVGYVAYLVRLTEPLCRTEFMGRTKIAATMHHMYLTSPNQLTPDPEPMQKAALKEMRSYAFQTHRDMGLAMKEWHDVREAFRDMSGFDSPMDPNREPVKFERHKSKGRDAWLAKVNRWLWISVEPQEHETRAPEKYKWKIRTGERHKTVETGIITKCGLDEALRYAYARTREHVEIQREMYSITSDDMMPDWTREPTPHDTPTNNDNESGDKNA